jgi:hypothetical protein
MAKQPSSQIIKKSSEDGAPTKRQLQRQIAEERKGAANRVGQKRVSLPLARESRAERKLDNSVLRPANRHVAES